MDVFICIPIFIHYLIVSFVYSFVVFEICIFVYWFSSLDTIFSPSYSKAMTNKLLAVSVVVLFFIAAFVGSIFYFSRKPTTYNLQPATSSIHVPEPNEQPRELGIAIPSTAQELTPGSKNKTRVFVLLADKNSFSANKIIVYEGDVTRIRYTAVDRAYDFSLPQFGLKQEVQKDETKTIEFQALSVGNFPYLCESCKNEGTKGTLIVVAK